MPGISGYERVEIEKLIPYINNARTHGEDQITRIAASIREFGFLSPCVIDRDFNVIAGHGRILAAKKLGIDAVPCVYVEGLTDAQRKAYILADNRLAEFADWDQEIVAAELEALNAEDFDADLTGFELPEETVNADDYGTDFTLPDGEQPETRSMTFILRAEQVDVIKAALQNAPECENTFGNKNRSGNALYEIVREWAEQKKLS